MVNILVRTLIGLTLFFLVSVGAAQAVQVTIDPSDYTGEWTVDYGPAQRGITLVNLGKPDATTGFHVISIGGAELFFSVANDGTVAVNNPFAAKGASHLLTFNTTEIAVSPVNFKGNWRISDEATPNLIGPQKVTLVRGLSYYSFKVGANGGFFFHISGNGQVSVPKGIAATGGNGLLVLKNTERFTQ